MASTDKYQVKLSQKRTRQLRIGFILLCLAVLNQNCGGGFRNLEQPSQNGGMGTPGSSTTTTTLGSTTTTLAATTTTVAPTTTTQASPTTSTTTTLASTTTTQPPVFNGDVKILFPPPSATSEASMVVRGASRVGAGVSEVSVNGVAATSSDGFLSWRATVPLVVGSNNLSVSIRRNGVIINNSASVAVQRFSSESSIVRGSGTWGGGRLNGMFYETAVDRMILTDDVSDGVWGVSTSTGSRTAVSNGGLGVGTGVGLTFATDITIADRKAMVMDTSALVAIDLVSGQRTLFTEILNANGTNREVNNLVGSPDGRTYLLTTTTSILRVDGVTAARTEMPLSGGTGPAIGNIACMAVSWRTNKAIISSYSGDQIYSVDLATGVRQVLSPAGSGALRISDTTKLTVDDDTNQVFVWDGNRMIAIDMTSGARRVTGNVGPLMNLSTIKAIGMTPFGPAILDHLQDYEGGPRSPTLFVIDPVLGTRVILGR